MVNVEKRSFSVFTAVVQMTTPGVKMNSKTMKLRTYLIMVWFFLVSFNSEAQTFQKTDYGIKSVINSIKVELQFHNPSTGRALKTPQGQTLSKKCLSVIETPECFSFLYR
jgi:alpha-D-xyloside xylohydrolase